MSFAPAPACRRTRALCAAAAAVVALGLGLAPAARSAPYVHDKIVVKFAPAVGPGARAATASAAGAGAPDVIAAYTRVLTLKPGANVATALARLRGDPHVLWAVPDFVAHTSFLPNDTGSNGVPGGWAQLQWNFVGAFGVNAPQAWDNLGADDAAGGRGVTVAVLDTGVAYSNRGSFLRSPDFQPQQFVQGYDFVDNSRYANDRNGHGTHVAGTVAEATNNGIGLTGLAYGARIMPVRVLDTQGEGDASVIAQGVRFAAQHGAQVINMSLEFSSDVTASDIPELIDAIRYAHRKGAVIVAAAGNEGQSAIAYPARAPFVISVGATTQHGCLANFSDFGRDLTIVAPGGGADADLPGDPNCEPNAPAGLDIYQETFAGTSPRHFGLPSGYDGTSMASPHVAAVAALIIASKVLGPHPTPDQVLARLKATTRKLGGPSDQASYGAGLVDAAAATAPRAPGAVTSRR
jgi:serine protease